MRVVIDTNVLIDGFNDDFSPQAKLIEAALQGQLTAVVTLAITREYNRLLGRLIGDVAYRQKIDRFLQTTKVCQPAPTINITIDDQEDLKFIAAAIGGRAGMIVTRDRHLLDLGEIGAIRILAPAEAWRHLEEETDGQSEWQSWLKGFGLTVAILVVGAPAWLPPALAATTTASVQADLVIKEEEIAALNKKIEELQQKKNTAAEEAELINNQIDAIAHRIEKSQLELKETANLLKKTLQRREETEASVGELEKTIATKKNQVRDLIRLLYAKEKTSLIDIWLSSHSLGAALAEQAAVQTLQNASFALMQELQAETEALQEHEAALTQQSESLYITSRVLGAQKQVLAEQKHEQSEFLAAKKTEQLAFDQKIMAAKAARQEIEAGLFALKNSSVQLSFSSAAEMAQYASDLTGVRPSLLLAVLKIESNMGNNIGSGHFPDDMQPASREPFLRLAKNLGRDPAAMPISRSVSYGWGGAMGPAQIMPQTWEGIQSRLAALLKKALADPYELTDAFVATALLLSDKGATTAAGEKEAVGRYLAGPNWQNFPWYTDRVFVVAAEYAKEGLK
jgi:putative PIN family toxin of toxin-antitoxin system